MSKELSLVSQTVRLHSVNPNPTRASPYSSGNRCLNLRHSAGNDARAVQQCAVSKRPGSDTPGGVALAQRVVRASTAKAKHETCLCGLPESFIRLLSPSYSGAWRCHLEKMALYLYR